MATLSSAWQLLPLTVCHLSAVQSRITKTAILFLLASESSVVLCFLCWFQSISIFLVNLFILLYQFLSEIVDLFNKLLVLEIGITVWLYFLEK